MSTRKIIVLNGHPGETSLNQTLAGVYRDAAVNDGHDVRFHDLSKMEFDMDYGLGGYSNAKSLEPVLEQFLADLEWAEHVVLSTPLWWGMIPGKLKGLIDRTFLPGRTFDTRNLNKFGVPAPMLGGKTGRVIVTADTPSLFLRLVYGNGIKKILTRQVFGFVGIKPTRFSHFSPASHPENKSVAKWSKTVAGLGHSGA